MDVLLSDLSVSLAWRANIRTKLWKVIWCQDSPPSLTIPHGSRLWPARQNSASPLGCSWTKWSGSVFLFHEHGFVFIWVWEGWIFGVSLDVKWKSICLHFHLFPLGRCCCCIPWFTWCLEISSGQWCFIHHDVVAPSIRIKGYEWVGWRNDTYGTDGRPVEMIFEFDSVRNFSAIVLHTNNMFSKDVQVSQLALFSISEILLAFAQPDGDECFSPFRCSVTLRVWTLSVEPAPQGGGTEQRHRIRASTAKPGKRVDCVCLFITQPGLNWTLICRSIFVQKRTMLANNIRFPFIRSALFGVQSAGRQDRRRRSVSSRFVGPNRETPLNWGWFVLRLIFHNPPAAPQVIPEPRRCGGRVSLSSNFPSRPLGKYQNC